MKDSLGYLSQLVSRLFPYIQSKPILLTGSPRSGTTFVGKMLCESPTVRYVYEPLNPDYGYLVKNGKCIICGCPVNKWYIHITQDNHDTYYKHFKHLVNSKSLQRKRALLKAPFSIYAAEWLHHTFNAVPIIMLRNPLSYVSSIKRMNWPVDFNDFYTQKKLLEEHLQPYKKEIRRIIHSKPDIIDNGILQYVLFYSYIHELREKYPDWLYIKLEDVSSDPIASFKNIFSYLDLPFTEHIEDKINEYTSEKNPTEADVSKVHTLKRNSKELIDIWKKRLDDDEVARIIKGTAEVAKEFYPEIA